MRRREFVTVIGGMAASWPLVARGQQATMRRVGVLIGTTENDPETKRRVQGLVQGLREAGWIEGHNIHLDYRFSGANPDLMRRYSIEIVALAPDVIVVHSNDFLALLRQANRTIPTVFAQVGDPVGSGFVDSLARPGSSRSASHVQYEHRYDRYRPRVEQLPCRRPGCYGRDRATQKKVEKSA